MERARGNIYILKSTLSTAPLSGTVEGTSAPPLRVPLSSNTDCWRRGVFHWVWNLFMVIVLSACLSIPLGTALLRGGERRGGWPSFSESKVFSIDQRGCARLMTRVNLLDTGKVHCFLSLQDSLVIFTALVTPLEMSPSSATQFITEERARERDQSLYAIQRGKGHPVFFPSLFDGDPQHLATGTNRHK